MSESTETTYHIDKTVYKGRPQDGSNRLEKEIRTYDFLDSLGVSYIRVDHDALPTIEACAEVDELLDIEICKNLFLCNSQKTDFYLLVMSGTKKFKTAVVSKQIGCSRLSFAKAEHMEEFMDITPGSVSILGLMNDKDKRIQLVIDKDLLDNTYYGCHPCINTSSIRFTTNDLIEKIIPAMNHDYILVDIQVD